MDDEVVSLHHLCLKDTTGEFCLLDLTNSKGNGVHMYSYDGIYGLPLPEKMLKGEPLLEKMKKLKDVEMEDDDTIICAYPKCGNHWVWDVLEMLKLGVVRYQNKVRETRKIELIFKEGMGAISTPLIFNSHYPLRMLPRQIGERKIKCVQIMRNLKDTCVSYFHHLLNRLPPVDYKGDFAEFTESFLEEKVPFGSYAGYIKSWNKEVSEIGDLPVVTLFYEDMMKDPVKCIKQLAELPKVPVTDRFCESIIEACSFK